MSNKTKLDVRGDISADVAIDLVPRVGEVIAIGSDFTRYRVVKIVHFDMPPTDYVPPSATIYVRKLTRLQEWLHFLTHPWTY